MALKIVDAGEAALFQGTLHDLDKSANPDGNPIALADIASITCTLRNVATGAIVNSRDGQNVLNANNCTVSATGGGFEWSAQPADSAPLDWNVDVEEHRGEFVVTGSFVGSPLRFTLSLLCCVRLLVLCRFEEIAQQLVGGASTLPPGDETLISLLIAGFADAVQTRSTRILKKSTEAHPTVEVFSPNGRTGSVRLSAWPVDKIISVKQSLDADFADPGLVNLADRCRMSTQYHLRYLDGEFMQGIASLEVTYAGGMARTAAEVPMLRSATMQQVAKWYQEKDRLGLTSITAEGGAIQTLSQLPMLPWVEQVIESLKPRITF